jgi:hypothetical protein
VHARLSLLRWASGATRISVIEPSARDLVTAHEKKPLDVRLEQCLSIRT